MSISAIMLMRQLKALYVTTTTQMIVACMGNVILLAVTMFMDLLSRMTDVVSVVEQDCLGIAAATVAFIDCNISGQITMTLLKSLKEQAG
jgi:hypothetical protein